VPSHVNASRTGTTVERSLLVAERSVWVVGVVFGGVVVGREVVWPVSVVGAVDVGTWDLFGGGEWEGPAAQTGGGTIRKSPWLATVFGAKDGRSGTGATVGSSSAAEKARVDRKRSLRPQRGSDSITTRRCAGYPGPFLGHKVPEMAI
jgi:hypothetical protein